MVRYSACLTIALLVGTSLRAGELDTEFGAQTPAASAVTTGTPGLGTLATNAEPTPLVSATREVRTDGWKASELDEEMPAQAWGRWGGWRGGWGGWRGGWGGRGFGFGGWGLGYGGWGGGWGLGYGGWGGGWGWGGGYLPGAYFAPSYGVSFGYGLGFGYPGWGCYW